MEVSGAIFHHYYWGLIIEAKRGKEHSYGEMVYSSRREAQGRTVWNFSIKGQCKEAIQGRVSGCGLRGQGWMYEWAVRKLRV